MKRLLKRIRNLFIPSGENAYRPEILGKKSVLFFLGLILVTEGFLIVNLVGRSGLEGLFSAVIGSEIIDLTNVERAQASEPGVTPNDLLTAAAQRKADDMAARGYFSHVGPDGKLPWAWVAEAGYDYSVAGENLAVRFVDSSDVVDAWMNSPTHKANIVKVAYREIGIGVAQGTYKGSSATFVVQFFGTSRVVTVAPTSPAQPVAQNAPVPQVSTAPEVAGESIAAQPVAALLPPVVLHQPSPTESLVRTFARVFTEPRASTTFVLGVVAALLVLALALVFLVHIQVQPVDLLLRGSLVAAFALFLIMLNAQVLVAPSMFQSQAAAVVESMSTVGVVISDYGASTEYFIVEQ